MFKLIIKNSSVIIIGVVISNILGYVFHLVAGRELGPELYGNFGALMSVFLLFSLPASAVGLAVTKYTTEYLRQNDFDKIVRMRVKILKDVVLVCLFIIIAFLVFADTIASYLKIESKVPVIFTGIILALSFLTPINRGIVQGLKNFPVFSINLILEAASRLLLLLGFLYFGFGLNGTLLSFGLAYVIAFVCLLPYTKIPRTQANEESVVGLSIYKYMLVMIGVNLLIQVLLNVPLILVKHYATATYAGYWLAALNIAKIPLFLAIAVSVVMVPEIAGSTNREVQFMYFKKSLLWVFILVFMAAVFFFFTGEYIILLLYGKEYLGAVPILQWMCFAMIIVSLLQSWIDFYLAKLKM